MKKLLILLCLVGSTAWATPSYWLSCLPDGAAMATDSMIRLRLSMAGWQEAGKQDDADTRLCWRIVQGQQPVYEPAAPGYGPWLAPPSVRMVDTAKLELTATSRAGSEWHGQQALPASPPSRLQLEDAIRALSGRLPLSGT